MNYESYKYLTIQREGGIATLTLNQPDNRNAVHMPRCTPSLKESGATWRSDREVNVIVFTGAGKTFSAGGDIKRMASALRHRRRLATSRCTFPPPRTACSRTCSRSAAHHRAVNGDAVGLGATLALFCDISHHCRDRQVRRHARQGRPGRRRRRRGGVAAADGPARAKEFLMRGRLVNGAEAHALGLVNHDAPAAEVMAKWR
jgi:enoyl-CoA hydratase